MGLVSKVVQVGRKRATYIPKEIPDKLGLKEGDKVILEVINDKLVLTPISAGSESMFWGEVGIKEVEEIDKEITNKVLKIKWGYCGYVLPTSLRWVKGEGIKY